VILHRNHEYGFDIVGAGAKAADRTQQGQRTQRAAMSDL
jgi:hypothetical protein